MHIFYIDDSKDDKKAVFSAIYMPEAKWRDCFQEVKAFRKKIKESDGILLRTELHATDFVAGRGNLGTQTVFKYRRCQIFKDALQMIASLPELKIINVCAARNRETRAFEYLLNRINTAVEKKDSHAVVISDRGKEEEYTRLARRMAVFNPIPSRFGGWAASGDKKNIPITRFVDDLIFKDSKASHFVQLADLCAYALLRKENQLPSKNKYGLHEAFDLLRPVLNRNASQTDPWGIVRC